MLHARRSHGFTLIELLVVIAIIAILAAMLFPVFARARESARKIQCLSNVKNIATAIQMYLTDYDRFPPREHRPEVLDWFAAQTGSSGCGAGRGTWANPYARWPVILDEYVKNRNVWSCPSAKFIIHTWWIVPSYSGDWFRYVVDAYDQGLWRFSGSSPGGAPCSYAFPPGWGGSVTDSIAQQAGNISPTEYQDVFEGTIGCTSTMSADVKTSQISDPSWYVVTADCTQLGAVILGAASMLFEICAIPCGGADWDSCPWTQDCGLDYRLRDQWFTDPTLRKQYTRHLGGSNVGFADGHAAWMSADAFIAETYHCQPDIETGDTVYVNPDGKIEGLCGKY